MSIFTLVRTKMQSQKNRTTNCKMPTPSFVTSHCDVKTLRTVTYYRRHNIMTQCDVAVAFWFGVVEVAPNCDVTITFWLSTVWLSPSNDANITSYPVDSAAAKHVTVKLRHIFNGKCRFLLVMVVQGGMFHLL